jgi:superfamily II DNA or RNA helicase
MTATLSNYVWIPWTLFAEHSSLVDKVMRDLTVVPRAFHPSETPEKLTLYVSDEQAECVGLPVHYGLDLMAEYFSSHRVTQLPPLGTPVSFPPLQRPDPNHPKASPSQPQFIADLMEALRRRFVVFAKAPTGSGKTVVALHSIAELGVRTLVVVPSIELATQWRDEAVRHLHLMPDRIGMVGGGECDYGPDKVLTIAVVHSMVQGKMDADFLESIGYVIWDEAHFLGADFFAKSMGMVRPRYRLGLSATPFRRDGRDAVFFHYFGQPCVVATAPALHIEYHVLRYPGKAYPSEMPDARLINSLCADPLRNLFLVDQIENLFNQGRQFVVFSDRIDQLQLLMTLCINRGMPKNKLGLFVGQYTDANGKRVAMKKDSLAWTKANAQVIFATYGMMKQGIDIPRLDAGLEASPKGDVVQAVGRARRPFEGKPDPIWYSVCDTRCARLLRMSQSRTNKMKRENATIIHHDASHAKTH